MIRFPFLLAAFLLGCAGFDRAIAFETASAISSAATASGLAETPAGRIRADLAWLADDARQGRETGQPGHRDAALYVAARFQALGLRPAGSDGYMQEVPLRSARRDFARATLEVRKGRGRTALRAREDFLPGRSFRTETFDAAGALVYVGYGVVDAKSGYDDYAGLDVAGKIVVAFQGAPSRFDSERRAHFSSTREKLAQAKARGAVAFLTIPTETWDKLSPWRRALEHADDPSMALLGPDGAPQTAPIEATAQLSAAGAAKLFKRAPTSYAALRKAEAATGAPKGFALKSSARLVGGSSWTDVKSPNVVGMIEGSDKRLKNEIVVLSAHLDHVGVARGKPPGEDAIFNGALDNAIGVSTMIEAARTLSTMKPRPKRSILFVAVTAEERGLLGAEYFARYPSAPGRLVADVNLDMPLVLFPFTDVIAFGAERSSLGPIVAKAAAALGVKLSPDPVPQENLFTRSDHYAFVRQGVPSVFLFVGWENGGKQVFDDFMAKHYHRPSDQIDLPIDYAAAARFADLNAKIAAEIAAADAAPVWNDGDFFGALYGSK